MEIEDLLRLAEESVRRSGVGELFQVAAFEKAFEFHRASGGSSIGGGTAEAEASPPGLAWAEVLATYLSVPTRAVDDVFFWDGDAPIPGMSSSALDSRKAAATKQLALLIAAARQGLGLEEWTGVDFVRRACIDFGRYDESNFAAAINEMSDSFLIRGRGRQRVLRLRRPGVEKAARLVRDLTGEE